MLGVAALAAGAAWVAGDVGHSTRDVRTKWFATSIVCSTCHSNAADAGALRDNLGRGVAPYDLWRSSMMANSARDPFFLAAMAAEVAASPKEKAEIEARCLHCHAPMASVEARLAGKKGLTAADLTESDDAWSRDRASLARDGVSCTLCHQIEAENLDTPASFDGGFTIGEEKEIYGPFDKQLAVPMHRVTKYWPVKGAHILDSAHCATCHTQSLAGGTLELATHLEWRNSAHREKETCQACHAPVTSQGGNPIRTRLARTSHGGDILALEPRGPIGRHLFVGGNTLLPAILRDHAGELHAKAPRVAFERTIDAAREQLRERTARVAIEEVTRLVDRVYIVVSVRNLAGHKFPTGHASRRAWLRVRVRDSKDQIVFASGEADKNGTILARGRPLASEAAGGPIVPHRKTISSPDEVQIYEAVLADAKGEPVFLTGRARGYKKDNRLLPAGWSPKHADAAATRPVGLGGDDDFAAGVDRVDYIVPLSETEATYSVEVALLYQPLATRHAAELFRHDDPEVRRFQRFYEAADRRPELIALARIVAGEQ